MEEWARSVLAEVDGELVLVGASMGGYCALAAARLAPERVRGLALVGSRAEADTPERREGRAKTIETIRRGGAAALWEDMRPKLFPDGADEAVVERARALALEQRRTTSSPRSRRSATAPTRPTSGPRSTRRR